ncbi:MAG: hypothetical protein RDV48_25325 [Candidatus Eremiobacteraeota bacterium]|nr:hypothetical protein [Candidatus Eremiobacteraeota bacterium]
MTHPHRRQWMIESRDYRLTREVKSMKSVTKLVIAAVFAVLIYWAFTVLAGRAQAGLPAYHTEPGTVLRFDKYRGYFDLSMEGDVSARGSYRWELEGFSILAHAPGTAYSLIPMKLTYAAGESSKERGVWVYRSGDTNTSTYETSMSDSKILTFPSPPEPVKGDTLKNYQQMLQWEKECMEILNKNNIEWRMHFTDHRIAGGKMELEIKVRVKSKGTRIHTSIFSGSGTKDVDRDDKCPFYAGFRFTDSRTTHYTVMSNTGAYSPDIKEDKIVFADDFSFDKFFLSGSRTQQATCTVNFSPGFREVSDDTKFTLSLDWSLAPKKEIDAVLEAVDSKESQWYPEVDAVREYRLTLTNPPPQEIEEIRFTLLDTSKNPGIFTNGGNHCTHNPCPDCIGGYKSDDYSHVTSFAGRQVTRKYCHYNECPIDTLEDMFFREGDNAGYDIGEKSLAGNLKYRAGLQITKKDVTEKENRVKVYVKDSAASARLKAEVMYGGIWFPAKVKGDTADEEAGELMLPLDRNQNGIHDKWEKDNSASDPDADSDSLAGCPNRGDGLTSFEEYRGVLTENVLTRLDPRRMDLFVFDYSAYFHSAIQEAKTVFANEGMKLNVLYDLDFRNDVVNYLGGDHCKGSQYILVIMLPSQLRPFVMDAAGLASHVGPPCRDANTVLINYYDSYLGNVLSVDDKGTTYNDYRLLCLRSTVRHEIGHNVSMPHHGQTDKTRKINGKEAWVAAVGGQHSGNFDCIMKYNCADYWIDDTSVPEGSLLPLSLNKYTAGAGNRGFFCRSPEGTGVNSGGCCRDATSGAGNCIGHFKVKSY